MSLSLVVAATRSAGAKPGRAAAEAVGAARAAWTACFPTPSPVPELPDIDDDIASAGLEVRRAAAGFRIEAFWGGSGSESVHAGISIRFEPNGCRALWSHRATFDGSITSRTRIGWVNRGAPAEAEIRELVAAPAKPGSAPGALARAWLLHACPGGPESELAWTHDLAGPIAPAQPYHRGRPQRPLRSFLSSTDLHAIGAGARDLPAADDEMLPATGGPEITGVIVRDFGQPVRTRSAGAVDVYEASYDDRNGARAIALYDRAADRHRWVMVTRGCVQGTTVTWAGMIGNRIIGITRSRHGKYATGDAILVLDVGSGTAWAVRIPASIREQMRAEISLPLRSSVSGTVVSLHLGRALATLDLAATLMLIP